MIVLDLPSPLSVNTTRRIDWKKYPKVKAWLRNADAHFMTQKRRLAAEPVPDRFEVVVTLPEGSALDLDNTPKLVIDALRRFRLIENDDPKHMRRVVLEFGDAPAGCRVTVNPVP